MSTIHDGLLETMINEVIVPPSIVPQPPMLSVPVPQPPSEPGDQSVLKKRKLESENENEPAKKKRKKGQKKRKRDPNAPKRPQTAYLIFYRENVHECLKSPDFKNKNGNVDMTLVSKYLGQKWKNLDEDNKQAYRIKYEKQKTTYEEHLSDYNNRKKFEIQKEQPQLAQIHPGPLAGTGIPEIPPSIIKIPQDQKNVNQVVSEWKSLKVEKTHLLARLNFLRQSFEKFRSNLKNLENDLSHLMEYLK